MSKEGIETAFRLYHEQYGDVKDFPITSDQIHALTLNERNVDAINCMIDDFYERLEKRKNTVPVQTDIDSLLQNILGEMHQEIGDAIVNKFSDSEINQMVAWARWGYACTVLLCAFNVCGRVVI